MWTDLAIEILPIQSIGLGIVVILFLILDIRGDFETDSNDLLRSVALRCELSDKR
jgi:hypothetical protein